MSRSVPKAAPTPGAAALNAKVCIALVYELAILCKQSAAGYSQAVRLAHSHSLKALLTVCAKQRREAAAELEQQVAKLRGVPLEAPLHTGPLPTALLNFNEQGRNDQTIVDTCKKGEMLVNEAYHDALERELPGELFELVRRQLVESEKLRQRIGLHVYNVSGPPRRLR